MLSAVRAFKITGVLHMEGWQRTLWIMFLAQMSAAVGFSMIFPFLPLYVDALGTNTGLSLEFWAGMVFSSQAVTMMFASPFWGALADRYGRKLMVQRATFGGAITIIMMAFVRSAEELVLLRTIQGLVTGTVAAGNALVAASAPRERTGYAMSILQVSLWAGIAIGPLIGGILADQFGFRLPFLITGALLFASGVLVAVGVHEDFAPQDREANKKQSFMSEWRHILGGQGVIQVYVIRFLGALSRSLTLPVMPLFVLYLLTNNAGLGAHTLNTAETILPGARDIATNSAGVSTYTGLVVGLASAAATISAVYLGRLGDNIGHKRVLVWCALASFIFFLPQAVVNAPWQLLILQALTGLAAGGLVSAPSALLARYTEPGEEGAVYGLDNSVISGARAVSPLVGAMIALAFGLRITFVAMALMFVVVLAVAVFMLPDRGAVPEPGESPEVQPALGPATIAK